MPPLAAVVPPVQLHSTPGLSWGTALQCLHCIQHLTRPRAAQRSLAVQGLLSQGLLPASAKVWDAARALDLEPPLPASVLAALLEIWVQLLAQMPVQPAGADAPEAATLANMALSLLKEAAVLAWQMPPDVAGCKVAVTQACAMLQGLLRVWPHKRHELLPITGWQLLAAAMAPLLPEDR